MFGLTKPDDRVVEALERIAAALEVLARTTDIFAEGEDESAVFYTNDAEDVQREMKREAYFNATGIRLEDGEEPPPHDA